MAWELFGSVFAIIFVAELPDKTALAALVLATRHRPLPVFFGAALALTVQSVVAVAAGGLIALLPEKAVHIGAGLLFLVCAVMMLRRKDDDDGDEIKEDARPPTFFRTFATVFGVVFIAEWGDLTQIGTATLAARYRQPLLVFSAATLALWVVVAIAVVAGNRAGALIKPRVMNRVAAVLFAGIGLALLFGRI